MDVHQEFLQVEIVRALSKLSSLVNYVLQVRFKKCEMPFFLHFIKGLFKIVQFHLQHSVLAACVLLTPWQLGLEGSTPLAGPCSRQ